MIFKNPVTDPKDEIILFVHGAWHGEWCRERHFMQFFTEKAYKNFAFDLTKHDKDGKIKGINTCSIKNYVQDFTDVINKLEKEPVIIEHSMRSLVLLKYMEKKQM